MAALPRLRHRGKPRVGLVAVLLLAGAGERAIADAGAGAALPRAPRRPPLLLSVLLSFRPGHHSGAADHPCADDATRGGVAGRDASRVDGRRAAAARDDRAAGYDGAAASGNYDAGAEPDGDRHPGADRDRNPHSFSFPHPSPWPSAHRARRRVAPAGRRRVALWAGERGVSASVHRG